MNDVRMNRIKPYLLIAPAMVGIALFTVYPVFRMIYLSFQNINLLDPRKNKFVGFQNYIKVFQRDAFWKALGNTAVYSFFMIIVIMVCSLILAVWIGQKQSKINSVTQVAVFTPHVIAMVSVSLIWVQMMEPNYGILNAMLSAVGLPKSEWTRSSDTSMLAIILVASWKSIGYYTLIFIAAIQSIPSSIYEAAVLDNAGKVKTFIKITLPMISPQIYFVLIVLTIGTFKVFDSVKVMTAGGPNNSTNTLVYMIYNEVFVSSRVGYAAVVGVVLLVIVSVLTVFYFISLSKKVHYQ